MKSSTVPSLFFGENEDPVVNWDEDVLESMIPQTFLPDCTLDVVPDPLEDIGRFDYFRGGFPFSKMRQDFQNVDKYQPAHRATTTVTKGKRKATSEQSYWNRRKLSSHTVSNNDNKQVTKGGRREGKSKGKKESYYRKLAFTDKYLNIEVDGSRSFLCPFPGCSRKFKSADTLNRHMDLHNEGNKRHLKCSVCKVVFYSSGCLKSHKISHVRKAGNYSCKVPSCGKSYSTAEGLRLHTRNHHRVDKKWKCMSEGCKRSFVRQSDLRMHIIRMHSPSRPYPCDHCPKGFACHSELRRHLQVTHNVFIPRPDKEAPKPEDGKILKDLLQKALEQQKEGTETKAVLNKDE